MIDDPISADLVGTVTLTMTLDDAHVLHEFLSALCGQDFARNLQHHKEMPPRAEQVTGKVWNVLHQTLTKAPPR